MHWIFTGEILGFTYWILTVCVLWCSDGCSFFLIFLVALFKRAGLCNVTKQVATDTEQKQLSNITWLVWELMSPIWFDFWANPEVCRDCWSHWINKIKMDIMGLMISAGYAALTSAISLQITKLVPEPCKCFFLQFFPHLSSKRRLVACQELFLF